MVTTANNRQMGTHGRGGAPRFGRHALAPADVHANHRQGWSAPSVGRRAEFFPPDYHSKVTRRPFGVGTLSQFRLRRAASLPCAHGRPAGRPLLPALSVAAFLHGRAAFGRCPQFLRIAQQLRQDRAEFPHSHHKSPFSAARYVHQRSGGVVVNVRESVGEITSV